MPDAAAHATPERLVIRRVEPDDLPALWALAHLPDAGVTEDPSVPVPLAPRRVPPSGPRELIDPDALRAEGGLLLVALDDDHLVGAGGLRPVRDRRSLGRLVRIRVHPARRRLGIARRLMEGLEEAAQRGGLTDLLLDVGDHQPEALAFYRALGWSETWREPDPETVWETVWFHRSLARHHLRVEVRPCAGSADVEAAERDLPSRRGHHHRRWERQDAGEATYLLAWHDDQVVGHALLTEHSRHDAVLDALGRHPEVLDLAVAGAVRRRGVGTALTGAAAGLARAGGATTLGLSTRPDDDQAALLCQRLGWRLRPGLRPVEEWTWLDDHGREHEERDTCDYWTLDLSRG